MSATEAPLRAHVRGAAELEIARERLVARAHVIRRRGARRRSADGRRCLPHAAAARIGATSIGQPGLAKRSHISVTRRRRSARCRSRNAWSAGDGGVDEVTQHVDVASVLDGADLDPRDELDAVRARGLTRRRRTPAVVS